MRTNQIIGLVFTILGGLILVIGILGIFGNDIINVDPWALSIIGIIFFSSGIGLLKNIGSKN